MTEKTIRIGTRKSKLALYQAELVQKLLKQAGRQAELFKITTTGDKFQKDSLATVGGKGLFLKEIEDALLDNEIDIAVHSLKDVPSEMPEGLCLAAFLKRDDPRDSWISPTLRTAAAAESAVTVGTTSLRRQYQLKLLNPNINFEILRGNVDTRLRKLDAGLFDAIVLSYAGLLRLEIVRDDLTPIDPDDMVPAVGQGCIVIESRADDAGLNALLKQFEHEETAQCNLLERELQEFVGGSCFVPFGAYFEKAGDKAVGRVFLHIEGKSDHIKIKREADWAGRVELMESIKSELKKYLSD